MLSSLPRPGVAWLDRRGLLGARAWIALVAFALIGIVTMQLGLLKLNAGVGRALEHQALLQRENAALSIENSELSAGNRVESEAAKAGMTLVPAGALRFLTAHPSSDATRGAAALSKRASSTPGGAQAATGESSSSSGGAESSQAASASETEGSARASTESSGSSSASTSESTGSSAASTSESTGSSAASTSESPAASSDEANSSGR